MGVVGGAEAAGLTAEAVRSGLEATGGGGSGLDTTGGGGSGLDATGGGGSDQDCGAEGSGRGAGACLARTAGAGSTRT
jgi:hypothetical protein